MFGKQVGFEVSFEVLYSKDIVNAPEASALLIVHLQIHNTILMNKKSSKIHYCLTTLNSSVYIPYILLHLFKIVSFEILSILYHVYCL